MEAFWWKSAVNDVCFLFGSIDTCTRLLWAMISLTATATPMILSYQAGHQVNEILVLQAGACKCLPKNWVRCYYDGGNLYMTRTRPDVLWESSPGLFNCPQDRN